MPSPDALPFRAAPTPRKVWVELTSKCPFDCVFCSRKTLRGNGQHLPYDLYRSLLGQLHDPRTIMLNYSGESTVYPDLIAAIQAARSTGAFVELVSALSSAPDSMLTSLSASGLNRLTVSLHAIDPEMYFEIYRYSSFAALRDRLERLIALCRDAPHAPVIDLAFVAMDRNLGQLSGVAALAKSLQIRDVAVFPVLRRDDIPAQFPTELASAGEPRPAFRQRVNSIVNQAKATNPDIRFTITHPAFTENLPGLGRLPMPYPAPLQADGRIHSCEQNPWETAHVLANGDVVVCEVLDKAPMGNLRRQSLEEIWHGSAYRQFRDRYQRGEIAECRLCPWKTAYRPSPLESEILGSNGRHAQLLAGWHDPAEETHLWSSRHAEAVILPRPGSRAIHVRGVLPPGFPGEPNQLTIECNGHAVGSVLNATPETLDFGEDFEVSGPSAEPWRIGFHTRQMYRPSERGTGGDQRDLGFALVFLASNRFVDPDLTLRHKKSLQPLASVISHVDSLGRTMRRGIRPVVSNRPIARSAKGLSIVIPERDNPEELATSLASAIEAAQRLTEPVQIIVVVNGSPASRYVSLRKTHPTVEWQFHARGLEFTRAVGAGLENARHEWVYLLNNDVALHPDALRELLPLCDPGTFSIASQIVLRDTTRYREETNWGALFLEDGLATIHDWIPRTTEPVETFYAGGGASLFQTRLLRRFLAPSVYAPFYWEDVEWGWRARKLGYRSIFCPQSVALHGQHATIRRHYPAEEVENVVERNRFLFQLRNFTNAGSLSRVLDKVACSSEPIARHFSSRRTLWEIARGRLWNHLAPIPDEQVFAVWNCSL